MCSNVPSLEYMHTKFAISSNEHTTLLPFAQVYYGKHKADSNANIETT
jgi:hypothetical protein